MGTEMFEWGFILAGRFKVEILSASVTRILDLLSPLAVLGFASRRPVGIVTRPK